MRIIFSFFVLFVVSILAPVITIAKPVPVEYFAQLPAIKDAALSPDGKSLAAIVEQDGKYVVATFTISESGLSDPRAFDAGDNVRYNWIRWANKNRLLIDLTRIEKFQNDVISSSWLYSANRSLTESKPLVEIKAIAHAISLDNSRVVSFLPNDPERILMMFTRDQIESKDVFEVVVANGEAKRILRGSKNYNNWITDRSDNIRIGEGSRRKGKDGNTIKTKLKIKQSGSGKWEHEKDHPILQGDVYIYGFDADPNVVYIGAYRGRDTRGLYTYNLQSKTLGSTLYHGDDHDVGGIISSADHKRVVGYYYTDDDSHYIYFDKKTQARNSKLDKKFPDFDVVTYDETPDGEWAVLQVSAPDYLPEMILYNYKTGKASTLSKLYPKLTDMDIGPVKTVKYTARDGTKIPAYVTLPPVFFDGAKLENLPFIIYPHGGPASRNYGGFDYRAQLLASRGYGVLQMNFRGSSGYGKAYKDAGRKNWQVMQNDVVDGVKWLIDKGYADKDRICIIGGSYGGYAAVISAINNPDMYACAASFAGVMDIPRLVDDGIEDGGRSGIKYSIASGFESRAEMRAQSPFRRVAELKTPLLLAHGERDLVVDYKHQFKLMRTALKKTSAKVTYLSLPNGDHYLSSGKNRIAYHKALDKFLADNLDDSAEMP